MANKELLEHEVHHVGQWDTIITPQNALLDFKFKEIWRYRDLLLLFVKRDFAAQYKQTVLGPLWHIIQPVFTTLIFLLVFNKIAGIPTDGIHPVLFYMSGITIWNYFATCLTMTSSTFISNAAIFGKVYFPRMIMPLSVVLSNIVKFLIQFLLLLMVMIWIGIQERHFYFGLSWLLIPVLIILMAGLGLGLGIIISSLTTKYRDFTVLISFAVQLLMYATPVVYPLSFLKAKYLSAWISWNPLTAIVECFRFALYGNGLPDMRGLLFSGMFMVCVLFVGLVLFNKVEKRFMDTV